MYGIVVRLKASDFDRFNAAFKVDGVTKVFPQRQSDDPTPFQFTFNVRLGTRETLESS